MKNGCDLTLLDTREFAVERRIDGEGMNFGQSINAEPNGEELFHLSPLPACRKTRLQMGGAQEQKPSKGNYRQSCLAQKVPDLQIFGS